MFSIMCGQQKELIYPRIHIIVWRLNNIKLNVERFWCSEDPGGLNQRQFWWHSFFSAVSHEGATEDQKLMALPKEAARLASLKASDTVCSREEEVHVSSPVLQQRLKRQTPNLRAIKSKPGTQKL